MNGQSAASRTVVVPANRRVYRFPDETAMLASTFASLTQSILELQERQERVHLAIGGGRTMRELFETMSRLGEASRIDSSQLELWWVSERYVSSSDPDRNSTQALGQLAKTFAIVPSQIHAMPMTSSTADAQNAAMQYAAEVNGQRFDLCVLGMGGSGEIGAIYPNHPSLQEALDSASTVIGVADPPTGPGERISLTFNSINRSSEVWVLASGARKAEALRRALAGDPAIPAAYLSGQRRTRWFVDDQAASQLPCHECRL